MEATAVAEKVILVVDDEKKIRGILAHHLTSAGYQAVEARSGTEALRKVGVGKVDLMILDIMMPRMNGFTVLERLRQEDASIPIPVVVCSAKRMREDVAMALQLGARDYIVKPFTRQVLLEKVRRLIGPPPVKPNLPPPTSEAAPSVPEPPRADPSPDAAAAPPTP